MSEPVLWDLDDHTRAKHRVLRSYLSAWLPVMGQQALRVNDPVNPPRLLVVDGFAGPGRYATGEDGSPLIMLKTLLEHEAFERMKKVEFLYLFIEHDNRRFEHLEKELDALDVPANVKVAPEHGEFEETFGRMVDDVHKKQGRTLVPTFAFIDPFGYSAASMSLAGRFLTFERCEALIFLPLNYLVRFVGREGQENAMTSLFGSERWREAIKMKGEEKGAFLLGLFEEQLGSRGDVKHVRSFELRTADGNDYRLVFATPHDKGLELMKDAMWSVDPVEGTRYVATRTDEGQEVLFQSDVDTQPLLEHLRKKFQGKWFTIEEAERATLLETPYRVSGHLKGKTLAPAEKAGQVEVDRSGGQKRLAAGVRIRFCD
ncbi:MAG TPA: three-Cys-motif partner protein TcmP [Solirubrobacterales bacterium]|nr:three-Cys-motif partner protein TcmP [Solirubrobacterales bacterium]